MEVLIADGMSTDATRDKIAAITQQYPHIPVIILDNLSKYVPGGLNLALQRAKGDVIVRVDGHTIIDPTYVTECVAALQRTEADNVGGRMVATGTTPFGEAVALATSSPFGVGGARFHYSDKEEWVDTVYMGAWPRATFDRNGTFDEELIRNQDDEFNYRLLNWGGKILLSNRIRSTYYNRGSLQALARQYFEYGYWKVRVMQKHPKQVRPRQLVPAALVTVLIGGALLAPFSRLIGYGWLLAVVLYAAGNLAASISLASRNGWRHIRWLPIAFFTIHISYGSGFLVGLLKFAPRWSQAKP